ncbi:hypothetical protein ACHAWF_017756 [Thalassiosira exigua]
MAKATALPLCDPPHFAEGTPVAIEPLKNYGRQMDLMQKCPPFLEVLLEEQDLLNVYDKFVATVTETKVTRHFWGKWRDGRFDSMLDLFRDDFTEKGGEGGLLSEEVGEGNVLLA